ncbi:MAG: hypothetical protein H3Z53_10825 [archaeon]|nr:hypothetical protein [archaeon]MCP8314844.1 hypothetical protein [archaeon]MCP8317165.1 hypothetical protein [archaeon]MCP8321182.1 hypothetical protein [archaeon]
MQKVKIISSRHAESSYAAKLVEEEVNKFLSNELPKLGGKVIDIKLSTTATTTQFLLTAMIIYTTEETSPK